MQVHEVINYKENDKNITLLLPGNPSIHPSHWCTSLCVYLDQHHDPHQSIQWFNGCYLLLVSRWPFTKGRNTRRHRLSATESTTLAVKGDRQTGKACRTGQDRTFTPPSTILLLLLEIIRISSHWEMHDRRLDRLMMMVTEKKRALYNVGMWQSPWVRTLVSIFMHRSAARNNSKNGFYNY